MGGAACFSSFFGVLVLRPSLFRVLFVLLLVPPYFLGGLMLSLLVGGAAFSSFLHVLWLCAPESPHKMDHSRRHDPQSANPFPSSSFRVVLPFSSFVIGAVSALPSLGGVACPSSPSSFV